MSDLEITVAVDRYDRHFPFFDGFRANRANLERFIMYSHDQGLIGERYPPGRLFVDITLDT